MATGILTRQQLAALAPYLEGGQPGTDGEWGLLCPLHQDTKRSASLNVNTGDWYCHACNFGANVEYLTSLVQSGKALSRPGSASARRQGGNPQGAVAISEGTVQGWHSALISDRQRLRDLLEARQGTISVDTLERFQIGWGQLQEKTSWGYTIPVRKVGGELANVRFYDPDPSDERRKIWSVMGMGSPVLYPMQVLDGQSEIVICEGEWDALVLLQRGFTAVTRTGSAGVWKSAWNHLFDDKVVYVCHDMDEAGQKANKIVAQALKKNAREVRRVDLPYEVVPKHGKDVTDFFAHGAEAEDFKALMVDAPGVRRDPRLVESEYTDVAVLDSFDSSSAGKRLRMRVTVTGRRNPTYLLPHRVVYTCSQDAGVKCNICPMNEMEGRAERVLDEHDPMILELMGSTHAQVAEALRRHVGAQKCPMLSQEILDFRSVEELYVRPAVDRAASQEPGDYTNRKVVSVGRHDSLPNNTVEVVGAIFPNPRGQHNEFLGWDLQKTETSIDRYEITPSGVKRLKKFQVRQGQRPLKKLAEISKDLARNVTMIYGRLEMHMLIDLTFHSVLSFNFDGKLQARGWMDNVIAGDTRTGKSEAAEKLRVHFGAGELISCESASFAGIVGGLQQFGSGKEWEVTWGVVPINDRRLCILDEFTGLQVEQIAQMSSIRSSGEAQLTKIRSERTWARTRLLWLGNPRNARMDDFTYGVQALRGMIGNNEDIARFDLAMSVAAGDVDSEEINRAHDEQVTHVFDEETCREMLLWVWSRKAEDVIWAKAAEAAVYAQSIDMGKRYVEDPPLVQAANVRMKIARLAVAIAARLFSTDESHTQVVVNVEHVNAAVELMDRLYSMKGFGYAQLSEERLGDLAEGVKNYNRAREYLGARKDVSKFLRQSGKFRRQDLEDMLNLPRETAQSVINDLWDLRMVSRSNADIRPTPLLHDILREIR